MISVAYAESYCCDDISLIENYSKAISDINQVWICHHRLEIQNGVSVSTKELKSKGLYYKRPANELIFLTEDEHKKLHGKNQRDETKKKLGAKSKEWWSTDKEIKLKNSLLDKDGHPWNYGKPSPQKGTKKSPETIQRMKEAKKEWWKNHEISEEERKRRSEGGKKAAVKSHDKLKEYGKTYSKMYKGKHWKIIDGKRVWID